MRARRPAREAPRGAWAAWAAALVLVTLPGPARAQVDRGGLHLSATQRTRFEHLEHRFRAGLPGRDRGLFLRTTLAASLEMSRLSLGIELADARVKLLPDDTRLNTSQVNPLDLLQTWVEVEGRGVFGGEGTGRLRLGRTTLDVGGRRLVARNRFRNTINAFTGAEGEWTFVGGGRLRAFVVVPVERRPVEQRDLRDNSLKLDRERTEELLWGVLGEVGLGEAGAVRGQGYLMGFHPHTEDGNAPAEEAFLTLGIRVHRPPAVGEMDLEAEAAVQVASGDGGMDRRGHFVHGEGGYTLRGELRPRFSVGYDFASAGFDTLFGARRFELGPTGLWGALARRNLSSPSLRLEIRPWPDVEAMVAHRAFWLARPEDPWAGTGLGDPTGAVGSFVGHQGELRLAWEATAGLGLEVGWARLWRGEFARRAPDVPGSGGDPVFFYVQMRMES